MKLLLISSPQLDQTGQYQTTTKTIEGGNVSDIETELQSAITGNHNIEDVQLSDDERRLHSNAIQILAAALQTDSRIKRVSIDDVLMTDRDLIALANALETNTSLDKLRITTTKRLFTKLGAQAFGKALRVNRSLTHLTLSQRTFFMMDLQHIMAGLTANTTLTHFTSYGHEVSRSEVIARVIGTNPSLHSIACSITGDEMAQEFAQGLRSNTTVHTLRLHFPTDVRDRSNSTYPRTRNRFASVASALQTHPSVTTLHLYCVVFNEVNASAFFDLIKNNSTLTSITFGDVRVENDLDFWNRIVEALEHNATIVTLHGFYNVPVASLQKINDVLLSNSLRSIERALHVSIGYQSLVPDHSFDPSDRTRQPYFDVKAIHNDLRGIANSLREYFMLPTATSLNHFLAYERLVAAIALFHLRCINKKTDHAPFNALDPRVKAAEECLLALNVNSNAFKLTCFHIGQYHCLRAVNMRAGDQQDAFAQAALRYFAVFSADAEFIRQHQLEDVLDLQNLATSLMCKTDALIVAPGIVTSAPLPKKLSEHDRGCLLALAQRNNQEQARSARAVMIAEQKIVPEITSPHVWCERAFASLEKNLVLNLRTSLQLLFDKHERHLHELYRKQQSAVLSPTSPLTPSRRLSLGAANHGSSSPRRLFSSPRSIPDVENRATTTSQPVTRATRKRTTDTRVEAVAHAPSPKARKLQFFRQEASGTSQDQAAALETLFDAMQAMKDVVLNNVVVDATFYEQMTSLQKSELGQSIYHSINQFLIKQNIQSLDTLVESARSATSVSATTSTTHLR